MKIVAGFVDVEILAKFGLRIVCDYAIGKSKLKLFAYVVNNN